MPRRQHRQNEMDQLQARAAVANVPGKTAERVYSTTLLTVCAVVSVFSSMPHPSPIFDCSSSCLNYLLPEQRDFVTKLRRANKYESFRTRTEQF